MIDDKEANLPQVTFARMIVAAIPYVGGSINVQIDKKIQERRDAQTKAFLEELSSRIQKLESDWLPPDSLVEIGYEISRRSNEPWKSLFIASLVSGHPDEVDIFLRRALIEAAADMNEIDICLLTTLALDGPKIDIVSQFQVERERLQQLSSDSPDVESLKSASFRKLEVSGLAAKSRSGHTISRLGEMMLKVISN